MWQAQSETGDYGTAKFQIEADGRLSYAEVIDLWATDDQFRSFFADLLRDAPLDAYRWETPPVSSALSDRPFEFVLIDCPNLVRRPDRNSFAEHFANATSDSKAISFQNVGRDATLVVPCPPNDESTKLDHFVHLASFVREADAEQVDTFWQLVGETMRERVGDKPVWLSTAGMGVAWLHVRLDQRPKYYAHAPYREERP